MLNRGMTIRSLSELLSDLQAHIEGDSITIKALLEQFHERGFGFFLFMIALPAALPIPALGLNTIIALPLMILTLQQAIGKRVVWVPQRWHDKTVSKKTIDGFVDKAASWVRRLEYFIKPRLIFMTQGVFSHFIGIAGFIMALSVAIPLPLTNTVPSFGIAVMAIGVLMRDGLAVIFGAAVGFVWIALLLTFVIVFGAEGFNIAKDFIKGFLP